MGRVRGQLMHDFREGKWERYISFWSRPVMTRNKQTKLAKLAFRFVLTIGIVNLFADFTYEGALPLFLWGNTSKRRVRN